MVFTHALTRVPGPQLVDGLTTADLGLPDPALALHQHEKYIQALEACGLRLTRLPEDPLFPDSCFIEDVAVCTPHFALITRPGALSRQGEIEGMEPILKSFFQQIEIIEAPGTLEGGDVMQVGNHFFIGLTDRTNAAGSQQFIAHLERYGLSGSTVNVPGGLHLKTGVTYLENGNLLGVVAFQSEPQFRKYNWITVEENEAYAANAIWINGTVLVPEGFPQTQTKIEAVGYSTLAVPMSEFEKVDGGLSCLSLRFTPA